VSWLETRLHSGREYVYAVHEERGSDGKSRRRVCYLGPKGGYEYVSKLHEREGLVLRGLLDGSRALDYLERLVEYLEERAEEGAIDVERLRKLASRLAGVVRRARGAGGP